MTALAGQIDALVEYLRWAGESHWRGVLEACSARLRAGDASGCGTFLDCFGTSGSFNECAVGEGQWQNGKFEWLPGHESKYNEFEKLKGAAYVAARELARETTPSIGALLRSGIAATATGTRVLLGLLGVSLVLMAAYVLERGGA